MKKELTPYQRRLIQLIVDGLISTIALLFSILSIGYLLETTSVLGSVLLGIACFFMAGMYGTQFFLKKIGKVEIVRNAGLTVFYLTMLALSFAFLSVGVSQFIFSIVFFISFVFDSTLRIVRKHKIRNILAAILKYLISLLLIGLFTAAYFMETEAFSVFFIFVPLGMALIAFIHAMGMVFSGIRKTTIISILRKTYSIEILYGLIILIVATSLVLTVMEDNMSVGDALWYCFAIVTTIGFGDITATTIIGRILSVILGIYGIIVVALITSIIVNFYNETKQDNDDEVLKEEMKKLEEQRKEEDKERTEE